MKQSLRCIWVYESVDPAEVWGDVRSVLERIGKLSAEFDAVSDHVDNPSTEHFGISDDRFEISFSPVSKGSIDQLFVNALAEDFVNHDVWIETLNQTSSLIQAFLFDHDYVHWQNAKDPLQYTAKGREYTHLPMRSNGLPPPLDQMEIDTSMNPGRWRFHDGYVEAVTSPIWLGHEFWSRAGVNKNDVLKSEIWTNVDELEGGLVRLQSMDNPFDSAKGQQSDIQNQVRMLLFSKHETVNNSRHRTSRCG